MNTTIYIIKTHPNSSYDHSDSTQEEIDIFDTNIHNVLNRTKSFSYIDSRNENTDSATDVYATSVAITINQGIVTEIEPDDKDSNICDLSIDFLELLTMRRGYDPYIEFSQETLNFLVRGIDSWFDRVNPA